MLGSLLIVEAHRSCPLRDVEKMQCLPFGIPLQISVKATIAQYIAVLIIVYAQSDVLTSTQTMMLLRGASDNDRSWFRVLYLDNELLEIQDNSWSFWLFHLLLPNVLKFLQGLLVLMASFLVIIIKSETVIDLMRDFTVLLVISHADNILFSCATWGNLGANLQEHAKWVAKTSFRADERIASISERVGFFLVFVMYSLLLAILSYIVVSQYNGTYMRIKFPDCDVDKPRRIGDGTCDNFAPYNTTECGFDGGDCN